MDKLRAEIAQYDKANLNRNDLRDMLYLQNILKKELVSLNPLVEVYYYRAVLPLYLSLPVNTRTATRDTILPIGGCLDRSR
jgi:hypothetical protein